MQHGEPVPDQPALARPVDRLDDDLAAVDLGVVDQLDPAMIGAVGDPHLERAQLVALAVVVDGQPEGAEADQAPDRPDQIAEPAE